MQRKEAEKLLAALIFDDLDEASKTELLNYLQTDNELRERLADMRMAAKVASDTVQHGPDPVLGKRRLKHLAKLARHQRSWRTFLTAPRLAAAAVIFIVSAIVLTGILSSFSVRRYASTMDSERSVAWSDVLTKSNKGAFAVEQTVEADTPSESPGKQAPETTSTRGQFTLGSGARRPDVVDKGYAYDPAIRGPGAVDRTVLGLPETVTNGAFQDDHRDFIVNFEEIGGAQTSTPGYAYLPTKPDSVEKWASASTWDYKPHSGVPVLGRDDSYYVGGYRGGGYGGYGGGHGVDQGGGMMGGYGGMGGFGGAVQSRYGWDSGNRGDGGEPLGGATYFGRGGERAFGDMDGEGEADYRGVFYSGNVADGSSGSMSGDSLFVTGGTYDGDKDSGSKEISLFNKSDATGIFADGIPATGKYILQNGKAVDFGLSGPTDSRENVLHIDKFSTADNDGAPSTVTVVAGEPVAVTGPELTPPPPPARPSLTMKDLSGTSDLSDIKVRAEDEESQVEWERSKTDESYEYPKNWKELVKNEAVSKKIEDELGTFNYQIVSDKPKPVKPHVPGLSTVFEGGREGEISKESEEELTHERHEKAGSGSEKAITNILHFQPSDEIDEIKALTEAARSVDYGILIPAEGPAGKEESRRRTVPILGDISLVGGLFRTEKKRPLTEEEKKRIVAYLEQRKSQPQGETAELDCETVKLNYLDPRKVEDSIGDGSRDLAGTEFLPGVSIESLPQDKQIIIFGRKDQREAVKNMIREIDIPPEQSEVDRTSTFVGEDEPDLPPASRFKLVPVNPWVMAERDSLSTFALDVDTASYTLCRRYIRGGFLPPAGAVRMEEFINYFNYHYPQRTSPTFKVHAEAAPSPFARREQNLTLLKIGVKARTIGRDQRKAAHLIFVVDASASMDQPDRLPLVQRALGLLVNKLSEVDRVSLITCANEARLHLETIPARERGRIRQAINAIQPAGPTNLLAGLKLGYATARRTFAPKQINHVVLCSDGVANVGQTEAEAVLEEVASDRKQGITITCVGVGYGSYNDAFLEALANQGDGSYMFLDSLRQVHRVFVRQLAATLQTVARDARIQVDFNPNRVRRYRLIGYENRDIEDERFRDDTIDAGEVGSGQCSTALYELELIGRPSSDRQEDLGTVFVRYRDVETGQFEEISSRLSSAIVRRLTVESAPRFFLAAGAARFAEILRQSEHAQDGNLMDVFRVVEQVSLALGLDRDVRELAELIRKAENLPRSP